MKKAYALVLLFLLSTVSGSFTAQIGVKDYGLDDDLNTTPPYTLKDPNYRDEANFMQKYTTYHPDGSQVDHYVATKNTYTLPNGEVGIIDQSWATSGDIYSNADPSQSIHSLTIDATGGTNGLNIVSNLDYYSHGYGNQDSYGGKYNISMDGWSDKPALPFDLGGGYTIVHGLNAPTPTDCASETQCVMIDNILEMPLCESANCTGSDHNTTARIVNGMASPTETNWEIFSNITDMPFVYTLKSEYLDSGKYDFKYRLAGEDEIKTLGVNDAFTTSFVQASFVAKDDPNATSLPHSVAVEFPSVAYYNLSSKKTIEADVNFTAWRTSEGIIFSINSTVASNPDNLTIDMKVIDPSVTYWDGSTSTYDFYNNVAAQRISGEAWQVGVDRDGGQIYGYGIQSRDTTPDETLMLLNCADNWYSSPTYLSGGSGCESGTWGNNDIGDGWCRSASSAYAGCQVQGFTSIKNHWKSGSNIATLPLIDSTIDFDGAVMSMTLDREQWTSQGSTGWNRINLELGLQAMGYGDIFTDKNWFKNCFNGYVDVFLISDMEWAAWENGARYGYDWKPGQAGYAWDESDPRLIAGYNWAIRPDNDWGPDEWWYKAVGTSTQDADFELGRFRDDGYTAGPSTAGGRYTMDLKDADYWHNIPNYYGLGSSNAQMKVNMFQGFNLVDGFESLDDDDFEDGGGIYTGNRAPGYDNIMQRSQTPYYSSFNHIYDYWDINFWSDGYFPYGASGLYDAYLGQLSFDDELGYETITGGQTSSLAQYHLTTQQLGTATEDFCYDPGSSSGTPRQHNMTSAEPDNVRLIQHDPANGQTYLNLPVTGNNDLLWTSTASTAQLVNRGFLEDIEDETIQFKLLVDIRSSDPLGMLDENTGQRNCGASFTNAAGTTISPACDEAYDGTGTYRDEDHHYGTSRQSSMEGPYPNRNVCWADWRAIDNNFDSDDGEWKLYFQGLETFLREDFCLDKGGNSLVAGNEVPWSQFIADNTCQSSEPSSSLTNEAKAFWCGLNLMSPYNNADNIRLMASTAPYIQAVDTDGDGVLDDDDQCPGTDAGTQVYRSGSQAGCPVNEEPINEDAFDDADENRAYGGTNDWDVDGIIDLYDKCDRKNGVGYATDFANYTDAMHIAYMSTYPARGPVDQFGCEIDFEGWRQSIEDEDEGDPRGGSGGDQAVLDFCSIYPDDGTHDWEDNDGDGQRDEDWFDGIDNDGDGQVDEDPFDDCPNDNLDLNVDPTFEGKIEAQVAYRTEDGRKMPVAEDFVFSTAHEHNETPADVLRSNYESYVVQAGAVYKRTTAAEELITAQPNVHLQCQATMRGGNTPSIQGTLYVWVPWDTIETIMIQQNLDYSDLNLGVFGTNQQQNYSDPKGVGGGGAYVPYGEAVNWWGTLNPKPTGDVTFVNANGELTLAPASANIQFGYALTSEGQARTASQTVNSPQPVLQTGFADGSYRWTCRGTQAFTVQSTTFTSYYEVSNDFSAITVCPDGLLPTPPTLLGTCDRSTGGGGLIDTSSFFDEILDSIFLAGLIIVALGLAVILWLAGQRQLALAFSLIAISVLVGIVSTNAFINIFGHVLLLAGLALIGAKFGALALGLVFFAGIPWFLNHAYHGYRDSNNVVTEPLVGKFPYMLEVGELWWVPAILTAVLVIIIGLNIYLALNPGKSPAFVGSLPEMVNLDELAAIADLERELETI